MNYTKHLKILFTVCLFVLLALSLATINIQRHTIDLLVSNINTHETLNNAPHSVAERYRDYTITDLVILDQILAEFIEPTAGHYIRLDMNHDCLLDVLDSAILHRLLTENETGIICSTSTFKSFMPYRTINDKSSKQYELQQLATTSEYGIRVVDYFPMIAVTSQFGSVGDLVEVHLDDSNFIAIIGDIKGEGHNDCQSLRDGSVIEFIVDYPKLDSNIKRLGDFNTVFNGSVKQINNLGIYY